MKKLLDFVKDNNNRIYVCYMAVVTVIALILGLILYTRLDSLENARKFYNYELIGTTEREYELLSSVSREYIDILNTGEIDVHTDLILDDLVYVDNIDKIDVSNIIKANEEITYYFDDMIITSHIKNDIMKTNVTKFVSETSLKVVVTDIDSIRAIDNGYSTEEFLEMTDLDKLAIEIASDINSMLQGEEGAYDIINSSAKHQIKESKSTTVKYINLGKDNLSSTNYNIAFIQLGKDDGSVLNMMCRLDSVYKIVSISTL